MYLNGNNNATHSLCLKVIPKKNTNKNQNAHKSKQLAKTRHKTCTGALNNKSKKMLKTPLIKHVR